MVKLNEVLGALMADLAEARHLADQQTVRLARSYRKDPVLKCMSVPRIRIPEVVVDLPIMIDNCQSPSAAATAEAKPDSSGAAPGPTESRRQQSDRFVEAADGLLRRLSAAMPPPSAEGAEGDGAAAPMTPFLNVLVGADELKAQGAGAGTFVTRLRIKLHEEAVECMWSDEGEGRGEESIRLIPE